MNKDIEKLTNEFRACQNVLTALGDENRQHLIIEMMQIGDCKGVRVGEITKRTNLSRPAVSHHIRILKEAGIVKCRKEGTKNYYYFDADMQSFEQLMTMLLHAKKILEQLPDRSGEDD